MKKTILFFKALFEKKRIIVIRYLLIITKSRYLYVRLERRTFGKHLTKNSLQGDVKVFN